MRLEGRNEKRVTMAIPVCLVAAEKPNVVEQAMTVNVSSQGARVATKRRWQPEEESRLALGPSEIRVQAKVVYCETLADGRFCIGLRFPADNVEW